MEKLTTKRARASSRVIASLLVLATLCFVIASSRLGRAESVADGADNKPSLGLPVRLSVKDAVARALRHNLDLRVQRLDTALSDAPARAARAAFAPQLYADGSISSSPGRVSAARAGIAPVSNVSVGGAVGVKKTFATGTSLDLSLSSTALFGSGSGGLGSNARYQSSALLSLRQPLLRGVSVSANQIAQTEARINRAAAQRSLARKAELIAQQVLAAYYDLHAVLSKDTAQSVAVSAAEMTLAQVKALVAAGKSAPPDQLTAELALAQQRRQRVATKQAVADARDALARLIGMSAPGALSVPAIVTTTSAPQSPSASQIGALQKLAFNKRADYLAALDKVELSKAKRSAARHALLPKLDLVGSVFVSGFGASSSNGTGSGNGDASASAVGATYWSSLRMDRVGWSAGLAFSMPLGNDAAKAAATSADLAVSRASIQADLVKQQIARQLGVAQRAVAAAKSQLALSQLTARAATQKLDNHRLLYKAGKVSAHVLASVQAEALKESLRQAEAKAALSKAVVALHSAAGNLLDGMRLSI